MDHEMGYLILLAIIAIPFGVFCCFVMAIATGVIHEPTPAESVAHNYRDSWKSAHLLD